MCRSVLVATLFLAGCAATSPDRQLPLTRAEIDPGVAAGVSGEANIAVTAVSRAGAETGPVSADCILEGAGFRSAFRTPAEIAVPSFGPASRSVQIRCTAGERAGAAQAQPAVRQANGLAGWPAVGVGVSSGGGSYVSVGGFWGGGFGAGPQTYAVRYPDVQIALE